MELGVAVIGEVPLALGDGVKVEMILKIFADPGQVMHGLDADGLQMIRRPHAGQQEKTWRTDRARGHDDFPLGADDLKRAAIPSDLDGHGASFFHNDARDACAGDNGEIGPAAHGLQVSRGRGAASRIAHRHLIMSDALLVDAVEIRIVGNSVLLPRSQEGFTDRKRIDRNRYTEWPAARVVGVDEALVVFGTFEVGQNLHVAPARRTAGRPGVVIPAIAAGIDLRVDAGATPEHFRLRIAERATAEVALRHR